MLLLAVMVPIPPFKPLCDGGCPDPGEWCIPHRVKYEHTIRQGLRRLIGKGISLATSTCHSRFSLQMREEAAMPHKIGGYCSSRGYNLSTHDGVKIGVFVVSHSIKKSYS